MGDVLMLYASSTGNTGLLAEAIADAVEKCGYNVITKTFDFDPIDVEDLLDYDGVLVGTYSWDDGELPYEAEDFYDELDDVDITGKTVGVFGSGDSFYYDTYGGAIKLFYERFKNKQAALMPEHLIIDLEPDKEDILKCQQFAADFCDMMEKNKGNAGA